MREFDYCTEESYRSPSELNRIVVPYERMSITLNAKMAFAGVDLGEISCVDLVEPKFCGFGGSNKCLTSKACDSIQIPPDGIFNSDILVWYTGLKQGRTGGKREEAWIPEARLEDFLKGERSRIQFQCKFNITKTERRKGLKGSEGSVVRTYWCAYGPKDERNSVISNWATLQNSARRSDCKGKGLGSRPTAQRVDVGLSMRRGCRCHFTITTDSNREGAVLISWVERQHIDLQGEFSHGLLAAGSSFSNAHIAPKLSTDCIQFVERLLRSRVPPAEILADYQQRIADIMRDSFDGDKKLWTRDMQLTSVDIRNIQSRLRKEGALYHHDDAQAIRQWTQRFPESVIYYAEQSRKEDRPFCVVFATPWMLQNLAKYGQNKAICMDATRGTNLYGFQLFTWLVYDNHQNGVPAVWALLERHRTEDLIEVQQKIKEKVEASYKELLGDLGRFSPSCFLCDDAEEEKASIRSTDCIGCLCEQVDVLGTSVHQLLSTTMGTQTGGMSDQLQVASTVESEYDRIRNRVVEDQVVTVVVKARQIPDTNVHRIEEDGLKVLAVASSSNDGVF
ncbi:hypothetical protein R1sor_012150 [Riccia sorocarpa]|uniref:Uncharacterized protein n=1 Tax=Riccia sorocarpa TaxID=122646 RepID=A0ABD3I955_9MARC